MGGATPSVKCGPEKKWPAATVTAVPTWKSGAAMTRPKSQREDRARKGFERWPRVSCRSRLGLQLPAGSVGQPDGGRPGEVDPAAKGRLRAGTGGGTQQNTGRWSTQPWHFLFLFLFDIFIFNVSVILSLVRSF